MSEYKAMAEGRVDELDNEAPVHTSVEMPAGKPSPTPTPASTATTSISTAATTQVSDPTTVAVTAPITVQSMPEHSSIEKKEEVESAAILLSHQPQSISGAVRDLSGSGAEGEQPMEVDEEGVLRTVVSGKGGQGKSGGVVETRECEADMSAAGTGSGETQAMETEEGVKEKTEVKPEAKLELQADSKQTGTVPATDPEVMLSLSVKGEGERGSWVKAAPAPGDVAITSIGESSLHPSTPPIVGLKVKSELKVEGSGAAVAAQSSTTHSAVSPASDHAPSVVSPATSTLSVSSAAVSQSAGHTPTALGLVTQAAGQDTGLTSASQVPCTVPSPNTAPGEQTSTALLPDRRETTSPIVAPAVLSGGAGMYTTANSSVLTSVVSQSFGPTPPASAQTESGNAASGVKMEEGHPEVSASASLQTDSGKAAIEMKMEEGCLEVSTSASAVSSTASVAQEGVLTGSDGNVEKGCAGMTPGVSSVGVAVVSTATSLTLTVSHSSPKPAVVQMSSQVASAVGFCATPLSVQPTPPSFESQPHPTPSVLTHSPVSTPASSSVSSADGHPPLACVTAASPGFSSTSASAPVSAHAPSSVSDGIHTPVAGAAPVAASSSGGASFPAPGRPSISPNLPKFRFTTITSKEVQALLQGCLPTTPLLSTPAPSFYSASLLEQNRQTQPVPPTSVAPISTASAQLQSLAHLATLTSSVAQADGGVVAAAPGLLSVEATPETGVNPRLSPSNQQSPVTATPVSAEGWFHRHIYAQHIYIYMYTVSYTPLFTLTLPFLPKVGSTDIYIC